MFDPENEYDNEDEETVMQALDREDHGQLLASFYRDGRAIRNLNNYLPREWDPSMLSDEGRGALPKEAF